MQTYYTGIKEANNLHAHVIPKRRAIKVVKMCRVANSSYFLDDKGRFYDPYARLQNVSVIGLPSANTAKAMVLLGYITGKQYAAIEKERVRQDEHTAGISFRRDLQHAVKFFGITLTKAQMKQAGIKTPA